MRRLDLGLTATLFAASFLGTAYPVGAGLLPDGDVLLLLRVLLGTRLIGMLLPSVPPAPERSWDQRTARASPASQAGGTPLRGFPPDALPRPPLPARYYLPQFARAARTSAGSSTEVWTAVVLVVVVLGCRIWGIARINPDLLPLGSDWHDYLGNARALFLWDWRAYVPDKRPLHALLVAGAAHALPVTLPTAAVLVSAAAMTLSAAPLYAAIRHAADRSVAVAATLLFGICGTMQVEAASTTPYPLLVAATATAVAGVAWGRPGGWGLAGLALGAGIATDPKFVVVAGIMAPILAYRWIRAAWNERVWGPVLVLAPVGVAILALHACPVTFTSTADRLRIQDAELLRFWMADGHTGVPALSDRVIYNLGRAGSQVRHHGVFLGMLVLAGFLARPFQRLPWMAVVASACAAFGWLYLPKFSVHAVPFLLALGVAGVAVLARAVAPRVQWAAFGAGVVFLAGEALPTGGFYDPGTQTIRALVGPLEVQPEITDLGGAAREVMALRRGGEPVMNCVAQPVELLLPTSTFGDRMVTRDPRDCMQALNPPARGRVWVVDLESRVRPTISADPGRWTRAWAGSRVEVWTEGAMGGVAPKQAP